MTPATSLVSRLCGAMIGMTRCMAATVSVIAFVTPAGAAVFLSQEEALELAFPGCGIDRRTIFLTGEQKEGIKALSGIEQSASIVYQYAATCEGKMAGAAYFDSHRVRTAAEVLMVAVAADGSVARVEILRFDEPQEYIPRRAWYEQFLGKSLGPELQLNREIRNVTGATLTGRATARAVRLALALHKILEESDEGLESGSPESEMGEPAESRDAEGK